MSREAIEPIEKISSSSRAEEMIRAYQAFSTDSEQEDLFEKAKANATAHAGYCLTLLILNALYNPREAHQNRKIVKTMEETNRIYADLALLTQLSTYLHDHTKNDEKTVNFSLPKDLLERIQISRQESPIAENQIQLDSDLIKILSRNFGSETIDSLIQTAKEKTPDSSAPFIITIEKPSSKELSEIRALFNVCKGLEYLERNNLLPIKDRPDFYIFKEKDLDLLKNVTRTQCDQLPNRANIKFSTFQILLTIMLEITKILANIQRSEEHLKQRIGQNTATR